MRRRIAPVVLGFGALASVLFVVPAGAASGLGQVTVSNQAPARADKIEVSSTGWKPGAVVSVLLTGTDGVIARARADSAGAAKTWASVPADAATGREVLSVVGSTTGGFRQQITTVLAIAAPPAGPAPSRPWTAVFLLAGLATILMLVGERSDRRERQLAV